jgi:hypothetical protein
MDQQMLFDLKASVNPLVYALHLRWRDKIPPKSQLLLWNLFQQWCWNNDSVPYGQAVLEPYHMAVQVIVKRRFGAPKDEVPW